MASALLRATAKLYVDAIHEALKALRNHPFKPLAGLVYLIVLHVAEAFLGGLRGFAGGMVRGLILTLLIANFLAFIGLMADGKRFSLQDLWARTLAIFGPLINSLFVLFIVMLVLGPVLMKQPLWMGILNLVMFVLFNPLPEIVARRGSSGIAAYQDSLEFMRENGPEWLVVLLLLFGPLVLLLGPVMTLLVISGTDPVNMVFQLLRASVSAFATHGSAAFDLLGMLLGLYYMFFVFLVRIALYERLSQSSRRKRIYALKQ